MLLTAERLSPYEDKHEKWEPYPHTNDFQPDWRQIEQTNKKEKEN